MQRIDELDCITKKSEERMKVRIVLKDAQLCELLKKCVFSIPLLSVHGLSEGFNPVKWASDWKDLIN